MPDLPLIIECQPSNPFLAREFIPWHRIAHLYLEAARNEDGGQVWGGLDVEGRAFGVHPRSVAVLDAALPDA